jgi:hypothetical protein
MIPRNLHHGKPKIIIIKIIIIKSKSMQSSLYDENIKRNSELLYDKKHVLFEFSVISEVWYHRVCIMKATKLLNCKKRFLE